MPQIICLGEMLVDWVSRTRGEELDQATNFSRAAGGAPANTAVGAARLGMKSAFVGAFSDDKFGHWLRQELANNKVDISGTVLDSTAQTRMAYVVTLANGDRKFEDFTRFACADERLRADHLPERMFKQSAFFHFGSISQITSPSKEATAEAIRLAAKHDVLISYDPNVRIQFWQNADSCKAKILETLPSADIVKINEDELFFLTGTRDLQAAKELRQKHNVSLLIVTLDSRGCQFFHSKSERLVPGFEIELVESTGAGDGFNAGLLEGLLKHVQEAGEKHPGWRKKVLASLSEEKIAAVVYRANAVGALTCTKLGAIPALPTTDAVNHFLEQIASGFGVQ